MKLLITNDGLHLGIYIEVNLPSWLARFRRRPKRIPGLHAGAYQVRDDFDDYLPEDFLITSE